MKTEISIFFEVVSKREVQEDDNLSIYTGE